MKNTKIRTGRKLKVLVVSLYLFLVMIASTSPALSEDSKYSFMFTVPIQMTNLSVYAKEVILKCQVKDQNGNWLTQNFTGASYGNNLGAIDSQGGFSGTLNYALKLMNPIDASKAKSYVCTIYAGSGSVHTNFKDCDSDTAYFCLKPGTPRTLEIQGTIQ